MKNKILFLILLLFISCNSESSKKIHGTWEIMDTSDYSGLKISEKTIFKKNGEYQGFIYSNKDSLINSFSGTFNVNLKNRTLLLFQNTGDTIKQRINSLESDKLIIENRNGQKIRLRRIK